MASDRETRTREPPPESPPESPPEVKMRVWPGNAVSFNPAVCPNCGSARNHIVKTYPVIRTTDGGAVKRLHECRNCPTRFTSVHEVNLCDVDHFRGDAGG